MSEIINDRLYIGDSPVDYVPTAHVGGRIEPTLIVLHDTAGGPPGDSVGWLTKNPAQVSAHVIVKPDGSVVQLAPFDRRTNHAGESTWQGRKGCNGFAIGIEIVNPGRLRGTPDKAVSSFGRTYSGAVACPTDEGHKAGLWLPYTEAQLATVEGMVEALARAYPTIVSVAGHFHVSPGRKEDPTPLMPWHRMLGALARVRPSAPLAVADSEAVRMAQARLDALLYGPGAADGLMGPRTRGSIRTFQDINGLAVTGQLDAATLARLYSADAKEMTTGTRDDAAPEKSGTITAAKVVKVAGATGGTLATGNALWDAGTTALAEADKAVKAAESGKSLATRVIEIGTWMMTPRGALMTATALAFVVAWLAASYIIKRRIAAHQEGRQA